MASLIGVEFATKRKSATETVLPEDESSFKGTAISTADGAKILKNLDNLANKYQELSNRPWTFIGDVANALGISMPNKASKYGIFEAMRFLHKSHKWNSQNKKAALVRCGCNWWSVLSGYSICESFKPRK